VTPATAQGKTTLTYATWNLGTPEENNLERQMLNAWNAENPNIQVVEATGIETGGTWMPSLAAAAAAGTFPDILMVTTVPDYVTKDWLADLTQIAAADQEWRNLGGATRKSTTLNNRIFVIPFAQHLWGFYVNKDLLTANNIRIPDANWTIADFTNIVKKATQPNKPTFGLTEEVDIPNWYPIAANSSYGWFTWDGRAYHLDGPEFLAGVNLARSFYVNGQVWETLPDAAKKTIGAGWHGESFMKGYAALWFSTTRTLGDAAKWTFKWDFLPIPGAKGRTIGIPDYLAIGKSSKSPNEAFAFATYMSGFSRKGFLKRIELVKASNGKLSLGGVPLTRDIVVLKAYRELVNVPSLEKMFDNSENGAIELFKWIPGYQQSRYSAKVAADKNMGDTIWNAVRGDVKLADIAAQLNQIANKQYQDAVKALPR
jgi:multiple sugar transport system substrate-binding protein